MSPPGAGSINDDTSIRSCNSRTIFSMEKVPTQPPRDPDKRIAARIRRAKLLSAFAELEKSAHQRVYSRRMGHLENLVSQDGCPLQHNRDKLEFFTVEKGRESRENIASPEMQRTGGFRNARSSRPVPPLQFAFVLRVVLSAAFMLAMQINSVTLSLSLYLSVSVSLSLSFCRAGFKFFFMRRVIRI